MFEAKSRDIGKHIQVLALLMAVLTLIFSSGLLLGGFAIPVLIRLPLTGIPDGSPFIVGLLGMSGLAMLFAIGNLALGMSAAAGLFKRRPWGRTLGIIDCGISLLSFPIGTLYGAYGLWVLLPPDAADYLGCGEEEVLKTG